jgi:type II secretory pathway pseudopilin PulG
MIRTHTYTRFRARRSQRGMTLLETLIAGAITAAVMGTAIGVYVTGTRSFYREQAQSFVQFRARTTMDDIAKEIRSAKVFLPYANVSGGVYASDGSVNPACLILQVPAQDSQDMRVFYYAAGSGAQNNVVTDTVVYRHNPTDKTLRCTVVPARNVQGNDGKVHDSFRTQITDKIIATNVSSLQLKFKDRDGSLIPAGQEHRTASVDIIGQLTQSRSQYGGDTMGIALSGVRLRNMRSGSIPGMVTASGNPVIGARLQAIYKSSDGAYAVGTIVGESISDANGSFEVYGLETGTYSVKVIASGIAVKVVDGIYVPEENPAQTVTITVP